MAEFTSTYKYEEKEDTEWDILQRKHGNLPPRDAPHRPAPWAPRSDEAAERKEKGRDVEWLATKTEEEIEELEDECDLGDDGDDDRRFLEEYRRKRMEEIAAQSSRQQFGFVKQISTTDYVREVTQASDNVWVVVHLFKDGVEDCLLLNRGLEEVAQEHTSTKFLKIVSTEAIPNYPDANLPTLLVYHNGSVKDTIVGMNHFNAVNGKRCSSATIELRLRKCGAIGANEESEGAKQHASRKLIAKVIEEREQNGNESEDSDFDD